MPGPYSINSSVTLGASGEIAWADAIAAAIDESASAPTANVMVLRDANGRAQVADPAAAQDIATLHYVGGLRGLATTVNSQTGVTYTPVAADQGALVTLNNAAAITLTLPQDSALTWPIGAEFTVIQTGAGAVTFAAGTGATVNAAQATSLQWLFIRVVKTAANTWSVGTPQTIPSATSSVQGTIKLAGDLGGTAASPSVAKIATATISGTPGTPSSSNFLRGDGTWAVPPGAAKNWVGGRYCLPGSNVESYVGNDGNYAWGGGTAYFVPFTLAAAGTLTGVRLDVGTAGSAGSTARLAIFSAGATYTSAATLVADLGTVPISSTGVQTISTSQSLAAGTYFVAVMSSATFSPNFFGTGYDTYGIIATQSGNFVTYHGLSASVTYGAYPSSVTPAYMSGFATSNDVPVLVALS